MRISIFFILFIALIFGALESDASFFRRCKSGKCHKKSGSTTGRVLKTTGKIITAPLWLPFYGGYRLAKRYYRKKFRKYRYAKGAAKRVRRFFKS